MIYKQDTANEYDKYHNFLYVYQLKVNEAKDIYIEINSEIELNQEGLQKIAQILLDNIVIINTEG